MSEKSILEQALLQVQTLEEAVKANAKGILASTMKQELSGISMVTRVKLKEQVLRVKKYSQQEQSTKKLRT